MTKHNMQFFGVYPQNQHVVFGQIKEVFFLTLYVFGFHPWSTNIKIKSAA